MVEQNENGFDMKKKCPKMNLLILGQTPPPWNGQGLSIKDIVDAKFENVNTFHIRMVFSKSLSEIGGFQLKKICHLFLIGIKLVYILLKKKIDICYYPPVAGETVFPILRDIFLLYIIRNFFPKVKVVLVFHAAGLSEHLPKRKKLLKYLNAIVEKAYFDADGAVQFSEHNPADCHYLRAKKIVTIHGGITDKYQELSEKPVPGDVYSIKILFVGIIREDKGVTDILNVALLLSKKDISFKFIIMGEFCSIEYKSQIENFIIVNGLEEYFSFPGVLVDQEKWDTYNNADIFCFPSFAPFESFPRVVVEAMMFKLPVVSTLWRGITGIVENQVTGFLVPVKSPALLAEKIELLTRDSKLRIEMGAAARKRYLNNFTREIRLSKFERFFWEVYNG